MNLETDGQGGYQDAHDAATENVWNNGLDLCVVPDSEDALKKS